MPTVWFSAYAVGTVPTRMSMISPMPFCPSFDPCAKLTPVHVSTSSARIQKRWRLFSLRSLVKPRVLDQLP